MSVCLDCGVPVLRLRNDVKPVRCAACAWLAELPEPMIREAMDRLKERQRDADTP